MERERAITLKGNKSKIVSESGILKLTISAVPPTCPAPGSLWEMEKTLMDESIRMNLLPPACLYPHALGPREFTAPTRDLHFPDEL